MEEEHFLDPEFMDFVGSRIEREIPKSGLSQYSMQIDGDKKKPSRRIVFVKKLFNSLYIRWDFFSRITESPLFLGTTFSASSVYNVNFGFALFSEKKTETFFESRLCFPQKKILMQIQKSRESSETFGKSLEEALF